MQIVYQGSYCKIEKPTIVEGKYTKDFEPGFYCTVLKSQAERWAKKYDSPSFINIYEYEEKSELNIKNFPLMTEEWLDFIINSRNSKKHNYDIVIGAMADDQIYNYISDLIDGNITREAFWSLAKFKYPTHQIAFCTEKSLSCLSYISSEEIIA